MARNLNIRNTIISLVILILLVFLGLGAIKVFNQKKGAIKVDAQAKSEHPDDEGEALREIDPCSEDPNWETPNYAQDGPSYNSSLICNCCYPGAVKCHVVHKLLVKGEDLCGKIPPSLATLPYLGTADFTQNYLSGDIHPERTSIKNLNYLSLYANNLSGPIPIYLGNMTPPVYVRLDNSMYCGTVPPELAKLFNMEHLILAASCQSMFKGGFSSIILASYSSRGAAGKLAVQYPPNACSTGNVPNCYSELPDNFTIHGLWPNKNPRPKNRTFNKFVLKGQLLSDLHNYWPDLSKNSTCDERFWAYEWVKHGPDYSGSQVEYFNQTVSLFLKPEINQTLNILLRKQRRKSYKTVEILCELKQKTKFIPALNCSSDKNSTLLLLFEVRFCLENNLKTLRDCPDKLSATCKEEFYVKI